MITVINCIYIKCEMPMAALGICR